MRPGRVSRRRRGVAVTAVGFAVLVGAGCSDDDDGGGGTLPPIATTTTLAPVETTTTIAQRRFYEIKRGDTLGRIAAAYKVTVQSIVELNGLSNADDIQAGQTIEIPTGVVLDATLPPVAPGATPPPNPTAAPLQPTMPPAAPAPTTVPG